MANHGLEIDHAVSASTVYLIRSLGTVYGVAITSAIVQNELVRSLPGALRGVPNKWKVPPLPPLPFHLYMPS
jgi:hypothetical protein